MTQANFELSTVQIIAMWVLPLLFAIIVHEVAHGWVAYWLGDKTAKILGRLSLNPIKHIDIFGTIILPGILLLINKGIVFGWAKPVPIDSRNLKHPRRDLALISVAGPLSNLVMAMIWALVAKVGTFLLALNYPGAAAAYNIGSAGIVINIMLMVFNMLPIPPLDAGHIVASLLPERLAIKYERIAPIGTIIILLLLAFGVINLIMDPMVNGMLIIITKMFGLSLQ